MSESTIPASSGAVSASTSRNMFAVKGQARDTRRKWLKRAGIAGFWFFLIKGILWLAAPLVFYYAL